MPDYQAELDAVLKEPEAAAAAQTAPGGAPDYAKQLADVMADEPAPAPATPAPAPKPEMGVMESMLRGGGQGVTAGFGDELVGALPGTSIDEQRAQNAQAQKDHPIAYGVSNAVGSLLPMAGAAVAGLPAIPAGLAYLVAQKFGNQSGNPLERAEGVGKDVLEHPVQTAIEAGLTVAGPAAGKLAGKGLGKVGDLVEWFGKKADNVKAGGTQAARQAMIEKYGVEGGPDMIGEMLRKYSPSSLFKPKTSAGHLAEIKKQLADERTHLAATRRAAGTEGADAALPAAWEGAKQDVAQSANETASKALGAKSRGVAREMAAQNKAVRKLQTPARLEDLIDHKSALGDEAFEAGLANSVKDKASGLAAKKSYQAMKNAEEQALNAATPETAAAARESSNVYSELSGLGDLLTPRAAADDAAGNAGTALASAVMADGLHPAGWMSALGSGTNNALRQMTNGVAHDIFSNVAHGTGDLLKATGRGVAKGADVTSNMLAREISESNRPKDNIPAGNNPKEQNSGTKKEWYDHLPPRQRAQVEEQENDEAKDELRELQK